MSKAIGLGAVLGTLGVESEIVSGLRGRRSPSSGVVFVGYTPQHSDVHPSSSRHAFPFSASINSIVAITKLVSVRLTKKLAATLNGVDVSSLRVGDRIELPTSAAQMLIAEGWAEPAPPVGQPLLESSSTSNLAN